MIEKFIRLTAWMMDKPASYSLFHFIVLGVSLLMCILTVIFLRNTTEKQNKIIILSIGVFLAITEVYKQLFYLVIETSVTHHYRWGVLSWQLCSIPMYISIIVTFIKNEKIKDTLYDFLSSYGFLGGLLALFEPSGLFHEYVTMTAHAVIWHMLLLFMGVYLLACKRSGKSLLNYYRPMILYYCCAIVAIFFNSIFWKASEGSINMFFLGYNGTNVVVFQSIFNAIGWFPSALFFTLMVSLGGFILLSVGYLLNYKLKHQFKQ